jgi:hypothetical protein
MPDESNLSAAASIRNAEATYFETVVELLTKLGVEFQSGLSSQELTEIEGSYHLNFPPDLRFFLQLAVPIQEGFPNWRGTRAALQERLSWPTKGICFDIERNAFWLQSWGEKPAKLDDAIAFAIEALSGTPSLIPIYKHRYIPDEPAEAGNPVLSVYQTDIVPYGNDLPGYFNTEFEVPLPPWALTTPRPIRFWDELVHLNAQRE